MLRAYRTKSAPPHHASDGSTNVSCNPAHWRGFIFTLTAASQPRCLPCRFCCMRWQIFPVILLALFLSSSAGAQADDGQVDWSADRPLEWSDYLGRPDPASGAAASTATLVAVNYTFSANGINFKIRCSFSPQQSWGLHKDATILDHEQGHFDISELFARQLCRELKAYRFNKTTYQSDLNAIYNKVMNERQEMQDQYDRETNHSINRVAQAAWKKKIARLLDDLRAFANYH